MMDSSTFKRFSTSVDNILENLEDVDLTSLGKCANVQKLLHLTLNVKNISDPAVLECFCKFDSN